MTFTQFLELLRDVAAVELFTISGTTVHVSSVATFIVILLVSYWVSRVVQRIIGKTLTTTGLTAAGTTATIRRLTHYTVMLAGLALALQTVGISVTSLFAAGAFLAVGVGFALQTILENFASGVILLGERSIEVGDVIELDGTIMKVERIGTRSTVTRTRDDDQRIIPNTLLVQNAVKNFTLGDSVYRIRAKVGVAYSSDMKVVEAALMEACQAIEARLDTKGPVVFLLDFADSAVIWEASIWAEDPWTVPVTSSDLKKSIWWTLKKYGVTIAFPQLDVHVISTPDAASADAGGSPESAAAESGS